MGSLAKPIEFQTDESGEVPSGAIVISFKNIGVRTGEVNGIELKAGEATNYTFVGKPYEAISYNTGDSTFKIRYTI